MNDAIGRVTLVGIGPGSAECITPEAAGLLSAADVLVGSSRALAAVRTMNLIAAGARAVELPAEGMADAVVGVLEREIAGSGNVALVVSGDPGFYSLSRRVTRHFGRERVRAVPGVSSLQILSCRLGRSWAGVATVTLHGRLEQDMGSFVELLRNTDALVVLLGPGEEAAAQIRMLTCEPELAAARAAVGWDLGLPGESVVEYETLAELAEHPGSGNLALLWLERGDVR